MTVDKVIRGLAAAGFGVGAAAVFGVLGAQSADAAPAPPSPPPSSPADITRQDAVDKRNAQRPKVNSSAENTKQDAEDKRTAQDAGNPERKADRAQGRKNAEQANSESRKDRPKENSSADNQKQDAEDKRTAQDAGNPERKADRAKGREGAERANNESKKGGSKANSSAENTKQDADDKRAAEDAVNPEVKAQRAQARKNAEQRERTQQELAADPAQQRVRVWNPESNPDSPAAVRMRRDAAATSAANQAARNAPGGGVSFGRSLSTKALLDIDDSLDGVFENVEKWSQDTKANNRVATMGPRPRLFDDPGYDFRKAGARAEQIGAGAVGAVTDTLRFLGALDRPEGQAEIQRSIEDGWNKVTTDPGGAAQDVADGVAGTVKNVVDNPDYYLGYGAASVLTGGRGAAGRIEPKVTPRVGRPNTVAPRPGPAAAPARPGPGIAPTRPDPVAAPARPGPAAAPTRPGPAATPTRPGPGTAVRPTAPAVVPRPVQPGAVPRPVPHAGNSTPARPLGKKAQQNKGRDVGGSPAGRPQGKNPRPSRELLPAWRRSAPTLIDDVAKRAEAKAKQEAGYPPIPMTYNGKPYGPAPITGARTGQPKSMAEQRAAHDAATARDGTFAPTPKTKAQRIAFVLAQLASATKQGTKSLPTHYGPGAAHQAELSSRLGRQNPYTAVPAPHRVTPRIEDGTSKRGWNHIEKRHLPGGDDPAKQGSLFAPGTTRAQIMAAAEELVRKGTRQSLPSQQFQVFEARTTVNGMRANYRVVVDSWDGNNVTTIFPIG